MNDQRDDTPQHCIIPEPVSGTRINWLGLLTVFAPIVTVATGAMITAAVQMANLSARIEQMDKTLAKFEIHNQREIDKLTDRVTRLETNSNTKAK